MKLLTYDDGSGPKCGVLRNDNIIDVATLLNSQHLRDVQALLELDDSPLDRVREALGGTSDDGIPLDSVRLRSPVLRPPTVRDFIVYEEHATGQGTRQAADAWYRLPIFYFSNTLRILGQGDHFPYPYTTHELCATAAGSGFVPRRFCGAELLTAARMTGRSMNSTLSNLAFRLGAVLEGSGS